MSSAESEDSLLILLYEEKSPWDSCNDISNGYIKVYESCYKNIEYFTCESNPESPKKLNEKIKSSNFDKVIFLDHRIRVPKELYYIIKEEPYKDLKFVFHIYGCFITRTAEWNFIRKKLNNYQYNFIAGSDAQKRVVEKVLGVSCGYIPFVVDNDKINNYNPENPLVNYNINKEDKVLLYAGRISPGKNVIPLCKVIKKFNETRDKKAHLIIIGAIDDMGGRDLDNNTFFPRGTMAYNFANTIKDNKYIHYIPHIENKEELFSFYHHVDAKISLSTMLFEDFGMSIGDALAFGKKIICTKWGGYKEFTKFSEQVCSIPVRYQDKNFIIDEKDVLTSIDTLWSESRYEINNPFSCQNIKESMQREYSKFSDQKIKNLKIIKLLSLFRFHELIHSPIIEELYGSYYD